MRGHRIITIVIFFMFAVYSYSSHKGVCTCLRDTVVEYSLEGISSEGTSVMVKYVDREISSAIITAYGCSGQVQIEYLFDKQKKMIRVREKRYNYQKPITEVESAEDMILAHDMHYCINLEGEIIERNPDIEPTDIFIPFTEAVPFSI